LEKGHIFFRYGDSANGREQNTYYIADSSRD